MEELIVTLPAVALRGMTILPGMIAHFDISRPKSIKAVEKAMMEEQKIFLVTQKEVEQEEPGQDDLYEIGIVAQIKQVIKLQNDIIRILVEGTERAKLRGFLEETEYLHAEICLQEKEQEELPDEVKTGLVRGIQETFLKYLAVNPKLGKELQKQIAQTTDLEKLMDLIANNLPVPYQEKQKILEAVTLTDRYEVLVALLLREIEVTAIKNEFQAKVKERVDKNQKEYILREQMKLIREELGEDNTESDADGYLEALGKLKANKAVKDKIKKEIDRFKNISSCSLSFSHVLWWR